MVKTWTILNLSLGQKKLREPWSFQRFITWGLLVPFQKRHVSRSTMIMRGRIPQKGRVIFIPKSTITNFPLISKLSGIQTLLAVSPVPSNGDYPGLLHSAFPLMLHFPLAAGDQLTLRYTRGHTTQLWKDYCMLCIPRIPTHPTSI